MIILENLLKSESFKQHSSWKTVLCQHPMYLLIDEDRGEPTIGERIPPWGAQCTENYIEKVKNNLKSLEQFPDLKLNYEFSGVEIESLAEKFPEVMQNMQKLYKQGVLDFVNGTYSQPHLQVFSSESTWRQFEFGTDVFKKIFGKDIKIYAAQETGLHRQLPQILSLFGYNFMAAPAFLWVLEICSGNFEISGAYTGLSSINGDEFVNAIALDGSSLPFYFTVSGTGFSNQQQRIQSVERDLYSQSPVFLTFPDMAEIDEELYSQIKSSSEFTLLESALQERIKLAPPRANAKVYTYWSYIEGVWAEELLRKNKEAEELILLAEAICSMAEFDHIKNDKDEEIHDIWKTILKYQHHDVYWIEVTDLRKKAISQLNQCIDKTLQIIDYTTKLLLEKDNNSLAVFNGLPRARKSLIFINGDKIPQGDFQCFREQKFAFVDLPAGGVKSFSSTATPSMTEESALLNEITTDYYTVNFSKDFLISQITTSGNRQLLKAGECTGGEIRALIGDKWVNNNKAECRFYIGDIAYILERASQLDNIPVLERYFFFRHENLIKAEIEFEFKDSVIGNFWTDETKINILYPIFASAEVYHDIPFGYVQGRIGRPLFAPNWLYCGGLLYVNRGTAKHWIKDGIMANVIAWGGHSFDNRMDFNWATKTQYDLRLKGKQKFEYFLIPYNSFDGTQIIHDVNAITAPVFITSGKREHSFYEVQDPSLAVTSIHKKENNIWFRGYQLPNVPNSEYRDWQIFNQPMPRKKLCD